MMTADNNNNVNPGAEAKVVPETAASETAPETATVESAAASSGEKTNTSSKKPIFFGCIAVAVVLCAIFFLTRGNQAQNRFSVRNGITFGMTREQVVLTEKKNGIEMDGEHDSILTTVSGYENCAVVYSFDEDGKLNEIKYKWFEFCFPNSRYDPTDIHQFPLSAKNSLASQYRDQFNTLNTALGEKYQRTGQMNASGSCTYLEFGNTDLLPKKNSYGSVDSNTYDQYGWNQYITPDGNNYVEIVSKSDLLTSYLFDKVVCYEYHCDITYRPVPKETVDRVMNQRQSDL